MKHWSGNDVCERDVLEGSPILTPNNPHPAYRGLKLQTQGLDIIYEIELVPGTERTESYLDPMSFVSKIGPVADVIYRCWDDDTNTWEESKMSVQLIAWGYDALPDHKIQKQMSKFDAAMKGI